MAGRIPLRSQEEKEQFILEKTRELVFREGIKSLTMDDISKQLGISKKTLYQVVANKTELVTKLVDLTLQDVKDKHSTIEKEYPNAIESFRQVCQYSGEMAQNMNTLVWFELKDYYPQIFESIEVFRDNVTKERTIENLRRGKQEGYYRDDFDDEVMAEFYTNLTFAVYDLSNTHDKIRTMQQMYDYHMNGIVSDKGRQYLREKAPKI